MATNWGFVSENSFEGVAVEEGRKLREERTDFNRGTAEILSRHLQRQALRAEELNAVPAPVLPGFTQGTGESVRLEEPLPPRNRAPGGLLPLSTPGAVVVRGYVTPDGVPTPAGRQFHKLMKLGFFDEDGMPTEKAKAYTMTPDDAEMQENLGAFAIRDKDGLNDKPERSWSETFGGLVDTVVDTVASAHKLNRSTGLDYYYNPRAWGRFFESDTEEAVRKAEDELNRQRFAQGAVEGSSELAAGGLEILKKGASMLTGDEQAYYAAKQDRQRFSREREALEAGELFGYLIGSEEMVKEWGQAADNARAILGPERAAVIERQARTGGALLGDPSNVVTMGAGALVGSTSKVPIMLRATEKLDRALVARTLAADLTAESIAARAAMERTKTAAAIASQRSSDLRRIGQLERADRLEATAARLAGVQKEAAEALPALEAKAAAQADLAARFTAEAGGAERLLEAINVGKQVKQLPFEVVGKRLEDLGQGVIRMNDEIADMISRRGMSPETLNKVKGALGTVGTIGGGLAGGLLAGPVGAVIGAAGGLSSAFAAGPLLRQVGTFTRTVGREMLEARGSIPFWQRVANNTELNAVSRATAHLADLATLGGRVAAPLRIAKKAGQGAVATAPMEMAFQIVTEGGDMSPANLKQAAAQAFVFGGGSAAAGAVVRGTLGAKRQIAAGNMLNFHNRLPSDQGGIFSKLPRSTKAVIADVAAAFPSLNWRLTDGPDSLFDPRANTIVLGSGGKGALEAIVAHEVNHYIAHRGQLEAGIAAALVGTNGTGGLLRAADGTLNPEFQGFLNAYNKRAMDAGMKPATIDEAAVEYFADATVQDLLGMIDSGSLAKSARRSEARRIVSDLSRYLVGRSALLSDLFLNTGTAFDKGGNLVPGTGILADGISTVPGARKMVQDFMRERAGRRDDGASAAKDEGGKIPMDLVLKDKPLMDSMVSVFETDAAGNVLYDKDGVPTIISPETDARRAGAGAILTEAVQNRILAGETLPDGALRPGEGGKWEGRYLPDYAIKALAGSGVFNAKQMAHLRMLNSASRRGKGESFFMVYQPATLKRKGKRAAYGSLSPTFRDVVPLATSVTNQGNILIHLFSATQLDANIRKRAASMRGRQLYNGDVNAIKADAQAMMDAHATRGESKSYFVSKYGPRDGEARLNFINAVFGLLTPEQKKVNPLFESDKITERDGVYKTYRLDRINQTTRLQGLPMPFDYDATKARALPGFRLNLAPNGVVETP